MVMLREEAENFLYKESRLLDRRDFAAWLDLFTEDAIYWLPMNEGPETALEPSVLRDDKKTLAMRVHQLLHKPHYAQRPPSRTVHAISNVTVEATEQADESLIGCNFMVTEMREGDYLQLGLGDQRLFAGHCEYRVLQRQMRVMISMKKVVLINRDTPLVNLSFIL
jgi:3-phenylpropionate/cinnamic acid dioxygenase small subunit